MGSVSLDSYVWRPEKKVVERLFQAIVSGLPEKINQPHVSERYYDKRSNWNGVEHEDEQNNRLSIKFIPLSLKVFGESPDNEPVKVSQVNDSYK